MNSGVPTKIIATAFSLAAFAVAVVAGLAAGNAPARVLTAALLSMGVCYVVGLTLGAVGERVVNEHLHSVRAAHPAEETRQQPLAPGAVIATNSGVRA